MTEISSPGPRQEHTQNRDENKRRPELLAACSAVQRIHHYPHPRHPPQPTSSASTLAGGQECQECHLGHYLWVIASIDNACRLKTACGSCPSVCLLSVSHRAALHHAVHCPRLWVPSTSRRGTEPNRVCGSSTHTASTCAPLAPVAMAGCGPISRLASGQNNMRGELSESPPPPSGDVIARAPRKVLDLVFSPTIPLHIVLR